MAGKSYIITRQVPEEELGGENRKVTTSRKKPKEKQLKLPVDVLLALGWVEKDLVFDYWVEDGDLLIRIHPATK